jgi:peptidoglycan/LPS O-acetylase OafA/YrhL
MTQAQPRRNANCPLIGDIAHSANQRPHRAKPPLARPVRSRHKQAMKERGHFEVLDGLRGVAALLVLAFHVSEITAGGVAARNILPHGALAVDFFFCLSGFVVAHAYDGRWARGMTLREFAVRRLIRLHPLVVLSTVIGAAAYTFDPFAGPDHGVGPLGMAGTVALALLVLPYPTLPGRMTDTHSLNGPTWTLFQEYLGNVAYALVLRHLSQRALAVLAGLCALATLYTCLHYGTLAAGFGWGDMQIAFVRLAFPFVAGMWIRRAIDHLPAIRLGFPALSLILAAAFAFPIFALGGGKAANGLLHAALVLLLFPAMVLLGAHSQMGSRTRAACTWLGRLSYPLYILHYPFIYLFIDYAQFGTPTHAGLLAGVVLIPPAMIALGWAGLRLWDEPLRAWLTARLLPLAGSRRAS